MFYKALEPGVEDSRMKGALWALNANCFGMCIIENQISTSIISTLSEVRYGWYVGPMIFDMCPWLTID